MYVFCFFVKHFETFFFHSVPIEHADLVNSQLD